MNNLNNIVKNIELLIDREKVLEYQSFLLFAKQQNSGAEFEIRFQNLTQIQFEQIKNYIEIDKYFIDKKESKIVSVLLPNDIRIERIEEPNDKYKEIFQNKREMKNMKMLINNIPIKFNLSREKIIDSKNVNDKNPLLTRIKYRTSYNFEQYYIELTYVETIDKNNIKTISFEAEIEFKNNKDINEVNVLFPIRYILKLIKPDRFSFMDEITEQSIRKDYLKILPVSNNKIDYIYENKPINFKLENIETFNHSITNKLNGVNFFLFFDHLKNNIHLINHSTVEYLGKDTTNKLKGTFLIQGELYHDVNSNKYMFYIFDTLIINSNNVIYENHKTRLDKFYPYFGIFDENLFYTNKRIGIQYKTFYGINGFDPNNPNDNHFNNLMTCLYSMSKDKNGNIDMEINDGFIFTPLDKFYINKETYKYKFPETMTIDFSVKYIETVNNNYIYNIFTYNENKKLVPFMNNKYKMICHDNNQLCKQIKNNSIVECFFIKEQNIFTPYRIRHDKILPNFYKVADNVFYDIMNPITLKNLEDSFKNKFTVKLSPSVLKPNEHNEEDLNKIYKKPENYTHISPPSKYNSIKRKSPSILVKNYSPSSDEEIHINKNSKPSISKEMLNEMKNLENNVNIELQNTKIESENKMKTYGTPKLRRKIPKIQKGTPLKKNIKIQNINYKVTLESILECVFFSVSPEYRESKNKEDMFKTVLEYFNNDDKIKDIDFLAKTFNIDIYILKHINKDEYQIINKSENENSKENKLYIEIIDNNYKVLGYNKNGYNIFIY